MTSNSHFFPVDITQSIHSINRCFGIVYQLRNEIVIRLRRSFTNNWKGSIVKNHISFGYPIYE